MGEGAMNTAAVARYLSVTEDLIQKLTREGRIPHIRLSERNVVYPKLAIDEWLLDEARSSVGSVAALGLVADSTG